MRILRTLLLAAFALSAAAQSSKTAPAPKNDVAVVNGEAISAQKLDALWDQIPPQLRAQYEKSGGKAAFLDNYIRKRLVVQEAYKQGLDKRASVREAMQEAKDSALFDHYIRDVVASKVVTDTAVRQYYDQHHSEFVTPDRVHVRHILITASSSGPHARSKQEALDMIEKVAAQLHLLNMQSRGPTPAAAEQMRIAEFTRLARQYSEDTNAPSGGDLGWLIHGQLLPELDSAAFALPVAVPSGILETKLGYEILLVEAKEPSRAESFEEARPAIREMLIAQRMNDIMAAVNKLADQLTAKGKIEVFPQNIK